MTAADLARSVAAGFAIAFVITAVILVLHPAQAPFWVFVPRTFSPAPVSAPHCTAAAISPAGLHGLTRCAP